VAGINLKGDAGKTASCSNLGIGLADTSKKITRWVMATKLLMVNDQNAMEAGEICHVHDV
jgi:hypothetical protein